MSNIKIGIKMRVNPEQSKKVQEICFKNGINWEHWNREPRYIEEPFLFITKDGLSWLGIKQEDFFLKQDKEEVNPEFFIRTNGSLI